MLAALPSSLAVAWSGGADSTALAWLLRDAGFDVQLWHINHRWRAESDAEAQALQAQAKAWGMPFLMRAIVKPSRNMEAQARHDRYAAFEALREQTGCAHVALAHHADDQAETVCMRLLQGAGVAGCQGMRPHREQGGMHYWRPLLHVPKQALLDMLKSKGVSWHDDPSNADVRLWRNRIRKRLFPAMKACGESPRDLFLRWQAQAKRVQAEIEAQACAVPVRVWREGGVSVCETDWSAWRAQTAPVRAWLLQKMIGMLFADGRVFGRRHIQAIEAWQAQGGHGWLNLSGCCLYRHEQGLQLCQGKVSLRHAHLMNKG